MLISVTNDVVGSICEGTVWSVHSRRGLARAIALLLIGRTDQAHRILRGQPVFSQSGKKPKIQPALLNQLRKRLTVKVDEDPWQRDGLLFELMTWIVAKEAATKDSETSTPHLKSTFQGTDGMRVNLHVGGKAEAHIYEVKCTSQAKKTFDGTVLKKFRQYLDGEYDDEITKKMLSLLERLTNDTDEATRLLDDLVADHSYCLHACLTIEAGSPKRPDLFSKYPMLAIELKQRHGHTLDLPEIRIWFEAFAKIVLAEIEEIAS